VTEDDARRAPATTPAGVIADAARCAPAWAAASRGDRAAAAEALADAIDSEGEAIVAMAAAESHLPEAALRAELARTTYQWRFFAEVIREGSYVEAMIDHAADTPAGPRPDLRRMLVPVGPVAVFGASNFPLAFSTAGGDTASALVAGCPVVVKVHPSHPRTSALVAECVRRALRSVGAPEGVFGVVEGLEAGVDLVRHTAVRAVAFTGSLAGGQALLRHIDARPDPIPFYGELSSINPVIVTPGAVLRDAEGIAAGLVASYTARAGQICTKPGVAFIPTGPDGDRFVRAAVAATSAVGSSTLLNDGIQRAFDARTSGYATDERVVMVGRGVGGPEGTATPTLVEVPVGALGDDLLQECFGPTTLVVRYDDLGPVYDAIARLHGSLTATVHHGEGEDDLVGELVATLTPLAGRIIFGGFPTGVAVSWAQHHGGPWPSTNSLHTSVGASAVRRFLRPVCWQSAPQSVLPLELRDGPVAIPRRVDGVLVLDPSGPANAGGRT
jgi:NADP-dependent aldehyde dehydrogenase